MKNFVVFFLLYFMFSCDAIKLINNQKITTVKNFADMTFVGKTLNLDVKVDSLNASFLFDTGAMVSIILDTTVVKDFAIKKKSNFGSSTGANGTKIKNSLFAISLNSALFKSENKVTTFINKPKSVCFNEKQVTTGIVGLDVFFNNDLSLFLDFSSKKISNVDESDVQDIKNRNQMKLIESDCKDNKIFIFLIINGLKCKFKLDTGYSGSIIMPTNDKLIIDKKNLSFELEGAVFNTVSTSTNGSELFYENVSLRLGNFDLLSKLNISTTIKAQNIGIDFIKSFDWLIDYNNNKIYIRKSQNDLEKTYTEKINYYSKIINGKIIVIVKEKSSNKYSLGDEITTINYQKVTTENICEMQKLLKETNDWNTLNLEVFSSKN